MAVTPSLGSIKFRLPVVGGGSHLGLIITRSRSNLPTVTLTVRSVYASKAGSSVYRGQGFFFSTVEIRIKCLAGLW